MASGEAWGKSAAIVLVSTAAGNDIAMKASQTGYLVLSTCYPRSIRTTASPRLRGCRSGIPWFLIASSVTAILSERLVRRLCRCHRQAEVTAEPADRFASMGVGGDLPGRSRACVSQRVARSATKPGTRGRVGIYEIVPFDETIRDAVRAKGQKSTSSAIMCEAWA
jgi:type II secretory ATPase GspE/PulE/Tfp pilus assembly ATPase PilB-like protein